MQGQSRKSIRALAKSALFHLVFGWVGFSMAWTKVDQTGADETQSVLRLNVVQIFCKGNEWHMEQRKDMTPS
jgi:hypothetical protein